MVKNIQAAIIDDNITVRSGLCLLISEIPGIEIIGHGGYLEAVMLANRGPHVLLIRLEQKESQRIRACVTNILQSCPTVRLLILAHAYDDPNIQWAFKMGARGCLLKESSVEDVEAAMREIARGNIYIPSRLVSILRATGQTPPAPETQTISIHLPGQQLRVLRLISQGYSNGEIARILFISKRTVEMHAYRLFKRLNVSCRTQAVQVALRFGLIDLQRPPDERETPLANETGL